MPAKKRRADGTLRPAVLRSRRKRQRARRQVWLGRFVPGARGEFFGNAILEQAVYLRSFARQTGLDDDCAAAMLDRAADERAWLKLVTADGTVVGIAPPRPPQTLTSSESRVGGA